MLATGVAGLPVAWSDYGPAHQFDCALNAYKAYVVLRTHCFADQLLYLKHGTSVIKMDKTEGLTIPHLMTKVAMAGGLL